MQGPSSARRLLGVMGAVSLLLGGVCYADDVPVRLTWPAGEPAAPAAQVEIRAAPRAARGTGAVATEQRALATTSGVTLHLTRGLWSVTGRLDGYWSQAVEVEVGGGATPGVEIALWPAATVAGDLAAPEGERSPSSVEVVLVPGGAGRAARTPLPSVAVDCPVVAGRWSCLAPAGAFDVELRPPGFVPTYGFGLRLRPGAPTRLRQVRLRRGASLVGWLRRADGSAAGRPCRVVLRVEAPRHSTSSDAVAQAGRPVFATSPNARGFFQLVGFPAGDHELSASCHDARASETVTVLADAETRLERPLVLEELALEVALTPPLDPKGRAWRLNLTATAPRWRKLAERSPASADGRWSRRGLGSGRYALDVVGEDGTQWARRSIDLEGRSARIDVQVPFVAVTGAVQLATRPLRARLRFVSASGGEPIEIASEDDGFFRGHLPLSTGSARQRWAVEVHAQDPPVNRRLEDIVVVAEPGDASVWLDLTLPLVAVRGTVVSASGAPQGGALVECENVATLGGSTAMTDADGCFELASLEPGTYRVRAQSVEGFSEATLVEVEEGEERELRLVLQEPGGFSGVVTSLDGPVAGAALQVWVPPGVPRTFVTTDAEGRFEVPLEPELTEVSITVNASGYPLKLIRLPVGDGEPVTIELGGAAGHLVLDLSALDADAPGSSSIVLARDGALESLATIARLAGPEGGAAAEREVTIPSIDPGPYALCRLGAPDYSTIWSHTIAREHCAFGRLEADETLRLVLPGVVH